MSGRVLPEIRMTQNRLSKYALVPLEEGWFVHNNHIIVLNTKVLVNILVNGLFSDPQSIYELNCPSSGDNCPDYMEQEFPIDPDLIARMYDMTLNFLRKYEGPLDTENNAKDVETTTVKQ